MVGKLLTLTRKITKQKLSFFQFMLATVIWHSPLLANQIAENTHMGTATCAGSQCHGKNSPQENRNVQLNEYTIWIGGDRHSIAYKTLETKESKLIARKLGLPNATSAKICLDCHTDNVPADKRGSKFQISDGVGCEGCHGGSEKWLVAGHPRLSFELDLFTTNQPRHYSVDDDYVQRKGRVDRIDLWMAGQFHSIEQSLEVAKDRLYNGEGIFPDFAFYDCHSCHHPMSKLRWTASRADGVRPGSPRLHMPNMPVIESLVLSTGNQALTDELVIARAETVRAAQQGRRSFNIAADQLLKTLSTARAQLESNIDRGDVTNILNSLLNAAAADQTSDYAEAEQIYYSYETLCYAINQAEQCENTLDNLFNAIDTDDNFDPNTFASVSRRLGGKKQTRKAASNLMLAMSTTLKSPRTDS